MFLFRFRITFFIKREVIGKKGLLSYKAEHDLHFFTWITIIIVKNNNNFLGKRLGSWYKISPLVKTEHHVARAESQATFLFLLRLFGWFLKGSDIKPESYAYLDLTSWEFTWLIMLYSSGM